jgi:hypothetical protein
VASGQAGFGCSCSVELAPGDLLRDSDGLLRIHSRAISGVEDFFFLNSQSCKCKKEEDKDSSPLQLEKQPKKFNTDKKSKTDGMTVEDLVGTGGAITFGGASGFCTGYALKKVRIFKNSFFSFVISVAKISWEGQLSSPAVFACCFCKRPTTLTM